ncbi:glycosyl hydrolase [Pontibacter silvestris]|uniref:Glycosyl hydrolase n=1 Tax=Pontibacter silvestris TaxID=2305183 RepID=A0ABW4X0C7_9BACT|nr:glycosyl hydrolase [Pontibacter silvestris]MCC9135954.1 hypothetical protein [Pontibacter silvestris]
MEKILFTLTLLWAYSSYGSDYYVSPTDTTNLSRAIRSAISLKNHIKEGIGEGEYPNGSKEIIQKSINSAKVLLAKVSSLEQKQLDSAAYSVADKLVLIEASVKLSDNPLVDSKATKETVYLYKNLGKLSSNHNYLFGMHDATAYGINADSTNWHDDGTGEKSDVKEVTGSHPALFSEDVSEIASEELYEIPDNFNQMVKAYNWGGVVTFCWHMRDPVNNTFYWNEIKPEYNVVKSISPGGKHHEWYKDNLNKLAFYMKSLRGRNGEAVPVIFRPFHEHNGSWFWWGKPHASTEEYNDIWKFTVRYLRDTLNVHNLIYAYSPDLGPIQKKSDYMEIYPGDDYVDMFGVDYYFGDSTAATREKFQQGLAGIVEYADERGKIAALTEFGDRLNDDGTDMLEIDNFYTQTILNTIQASPKASRIAFLATWRNGHTKHHFAPYPRHKEADDFVRFYEDTAAVFLDEMVNMYDGVITGKPRRLSDVTEIYSFRTSNSDSTTINDNAIVVYAPKGAKLKKLAPVFKVADGATVRVNGVVQQSGETVHSFKKPVTYTVIAENGKEAREYTVVAKKVKSSTYINK